MMHLHMHGIVSFTLLAPHSVEDQLKQQITGQDLLIPDKSMVFTATWDSQKTTWF
jgi:hypothetical protein